MAAEITFDVLDIDQVLSVFTRLNVYRSATKDGLFVELTRPETRPVLRAGQISYTYLDADAPDGAWYASCYSNPVTSALSSRSEPQQQGCDGALGILSVERLRQDYLYGLRMLDREGNPLPRSVYETGIRTGVAWLERRLGLTLAPRIITDEAHDYRVDRDRAYMLMHLDHVPIRSVQSLRLVWPGQVRQATTPVPNEWLRVDSFDGTIEVVPSSSAPLTYGPRYALSSLWVQGGYGNPRDYIPGVASVSYVAGFPKGKLPADMLDLIAKAASMHPLAVGGDLVGPLGVGSSSVSIDGLGQSIGRIANTSANAYGARMSAYMAQLQADIPMIRAAYRGSPLRVV